MTKEFRGRPVIAGNCTGEGLVTKSGFNTLASFQKSAMAKSSEAVCSDQNNQDLFGKVLSGKILCLPRTIGSTTGGIVLQTVADMGIAPAAFLFSEEIDSLAAAGVILSKIWNDRIIVTVDKLGADFLQTVKNGDTIEILEDGLVRITQN